MPAGELYDASDAEIQSDHRAAMAWLVRYNAMLGCDLRFDPAPTAAVSGNHDLSLHVDSALGKSLVIVRGPVVDVNKLAGHIPVLRVGVIDRKLFRSLIGS